MIKGLIKDLIKLFRRVGVCVKNYDKKSLVFLIEKFFEVSDYCVDKYEESESVWESIKWYDLYNLCDNLECDKYEKIFDSYKEECINNDFGDMSDWEKKVLKGELK